MGSFHGFSLEILSNLRRDRGHLYPARLFALGTVDTVSLTGQPVVEGGEGVFR